MWISDCMGGGSAPLNLMLFKGRLYNRKRSLLERREGRKSYWGRKIEQSV